MRLNETTVILGQNVALVPYRREHVLVCITATISRAST